jgi:type VI secretion system protein ImpM
MTDIPGWYGKLPGLGDFAQRRLPAGFVAPWDAWLQEGITHSKAVLGDTWLDSYLTAHIWHFVLMPGVLDPQPWAGVWMPSVDKVGRYFPFTLAVALPPETPLAVSAIALGSWLEQLEDCARQCLDLDHGIKSLETSLEYLGPPPLGEAVSPHLSHAGDRFARRDQLISLPSWEGSSVLADCLASLASRTLQSALAGYSLWWCHAANGLSGGFAHRSLPTASFLTKMITYSPADSGDHSHRGLSGG